MTFRTKTVDNHFLHNKLQLYNSSNSEVFRCVFRLQIRMVGGGHCLASQFLKWRLFQDKRFVAFVIEFCVCFNNGCVVLGDAQKTEKLKDFKKF